MMSRPTLLKVTFKGDQINALNEILWDYISILQHSYKTWAAALSARQYAIEHPEMIDKKTLESNPTIFDDIKKEIETMEKDLPHIEVAITRAMQLKEQLPLQNNEKETNETNSVQPTWELQNDTAGNQPDAEVPENA